MTSDFADRLEQALLDAGRRRGARSPRRGTWVLVASAAVTAAVVAVVFVIGGIGGGSQGRAGGAAPSTVGSGDCTAHAAGPHPAHTTTRSPSRRLLNALPVLRRPEPRHAPLGQGFIPVNQFVYDTVLVYSRHVRTIRGPGGTTLALLPAVDCVSSRPGGVGIPEEHLLVEVSGPPLASPRVLDAGSTRQIADGSAFTSTGAGHHRSLQIIVAGAHAATVELRLTSAVSSPYTRTLPVHDGIASTILPNENGPTTITSHGAGGRVIHRYVNRTALRADRCLRHHKASACLSAGGQP